ncbi:glycosyltransferase family 4 protein [Aetokthonos hydrillicola Thurmond2011]|jgi:glycosyltransferase involved in cell wall biosynthesis|uniref:Glycosyltransferase family 4 protein n=1 Tax=Aetokthonos hydrillicola Thurmond2011 TaxID=2712845 RepID=A0AAP5M6Q7_9CYAN|nr:glycosyltransferase family 4 protein [Aetokthonos hydrillicola]MBO3459260.1 glycosyltransferase family 4 protein [Aetokthonos hydrillicola CCALA 1050]MBW4584906.1 glycosyltransferase family 4 protein [Aetokthonos hydrillicola CCALA 1050]MDR9894335.1 glycosyltransferase family 4 protein [Aetokthonos hydrillicola Thurmond2011]
MNISIGILFSSYGPYHIARVKGLVNSPQMLHKEIVAIEVARFQQEYPWKTKINNLGFSVVSVVQEQALEKSKTVELFQKLNHVLKTVNPSVIAIAGYFQISMLFALAWCLWHRKPAILFSETTEHDAPRSWWREALKSWIVKRYKCALVGGQVHKQYLIKLGMPSEAIFLGYDIVGNDAFHPDKIRHLPSPLVKPYFLAINRFVPKKNLAFLISCYVAYRKAIGNHSCAWDLVICGDGELRPQIEQQITELGIKDYIHLPGFLQQDELLPYFAHAKCFIHASIQEQWGLVVNEAMASGLPVIVSKHCGCFEELVMEGINGFGFAPDNQQELINLMIKISSGQVDLQAMGQASLKHIQKFSPEYFAQNLSKAINYATTH